MNIRKINAGIAAALTVFFIAHELLGMLWSYSAVEQKLAFLVWIGVAVAAIHVLLCLATSKSMLGDEKRPPSAKKKRHLALKWVTGGVVLAAAALHAMQIQVPLLLFCTGMCTAAFLAVHVCTGVKSLTRDLNMPSTARTPFKVIVIAATCAICGALILNFALYA